MKKFLILTICASLTLFITVFPKNVIAQTLKITEVDASSTHKFKKVSESLGKEIKMTFYDNSLKLNLQGEKTPMVLKKYTDTSYYLLDNYTTYRLSIEKMFGVISAITLRINKTNNESDWQSVTAKRF